MPNTTDPHPPSPEPQRPEPGLLEQRQWLREMLGCMGDAVIAADAHGLVTFLNPTAQALTGWTQEAAVGIPLGDVFKIKGESRQAVESPAVRALRDGEIVGLANHTLLVAEDGTERSIDDSAAPIDRKSTRLNSSHSS